MENERELEERYAELEERERQLEERERQLEERENTSKSLNDRMEKARKERLKRDRTKGVKVIIRGVE